MIVVRFTDYDYTQEWNNYEIHESGDWVVLWDDGENADRDTVPRERIESIEEQLVESNLPAVQGGKDMPSDWPLRKQRILARDGFMCQNCWKMGGKMGSKDLEVHHIVPRAVPVGTHRLTNLTTLCEGCHRAIPRV